MTSQGEPTCGCGCGEATGFSARTRTALGWRKGDPIPFKKGHRQRVLQPRLTGRYEVDPLTGCWVWQGKKNHADYGRISIRGRWHQAHRVYYEHFVGPIPSGMHIDHLCRNHSCVNPAHLEPVTSAENSRRGLVAKLTWTQVREIRASSEPAAHLAAQYGVLPDTVGKVRRGDSWQTERAVERGIA